MKHKILLIAFTLVTLFVCAFGLSACGEEEKQPSEGLAYTLSDDGTSYIVSGIGTCKDKNIVIPSTYNNLPVTEIGNRAFYDCDSLKSIVIPDGLTEIGSGAFYKCIWLKSITIGNGVTSIGDSAFSGCTNLKYNEYDNVYYLGNDSNPYVVLMYAKSKDITSCTINENTKFIYYRAFYECTSLTSIVIPDSVTSIGNYAFWDCRSLTSVTIGKGVTSIGEGAFEYCTSLASITIPDSVTSIGDEAFRSCTSLTSVTIGNGVTSIGWNAFYYCTSLASVTIGEGVTSIGYEAFDNCTSLKYNEYDNAYYLGNDSNPYVVLMYAKNTDITSCTINEKTKVIGEDAFAYCTSLTSIVIPDNVTSIGSSTFYGCTSLTSVTFKNKNGWWVSDDSDTTSISSADLADPATAAKYLAGTYSWYYWKRS